MKKQLLIRPATPLDHAFIYATYLRNLWYSKSNETTLKKAMWMRLMHGRLEKLMTADPPLVACLADDEETILGYSVRESKDTCFVYVKLAFRPEKFGVMKALQEASVKQEEKP